MDDNNIEYFYKNTYVSIIRFWGKNMKRKIPSSVILVFGILFVIVGLMLYLPARETVEHYDSYGVFGDIGREVVPEWDEEYNTAKSRSTFGIIGLIIGFILTIAGIVFVATGKNIEF